MFEIMAHAFEVKLYDTSVLELFVYFAKIN